MKPLSCSVQGQWRILYLDFIGVKHSKILKSTSFRDERYWHGYPTVTTKIRVRHFYDTIYCHETICKPTEASPVCRLPFLIFKALLSNTQPQFINFVNKDNRT